MKININQIPPEGLSLEESIASQGLDLDIDIIRLKTPVKIKAKLSKITNALSVDMTLEGTIGFVCSRCLSDKEINFKKRLAFSYPVDKSHPIIEFDQDIRESILLDYPLKPLCKPDCRGLCPYCGRDLNQEKCNCVS